MVKVVRKRRSLTWAWKFVQIPQRNERKTLIAERDSLCRDVGAGSNMGYVWQIVIDLFEEEDEAWLGYEHQMSTERDKA